MQMHVLPGVFMRRDPEVPGIPVLFDIPRSGAEYPRGFRSIASLEDIQKSVSSYVEALYAETPAAGATWLYASFPNAYIDPNRHELDIDPASLDGPWPVELQPSPKTSTGIGLIPTICAGTKPIYAGKLAVADVQQRLTEYYWPYHNELARILAAYKARFGVAYHLSCHSMPEFIAGTGPDAGQRRSDFDLGDRNGTTAGREIVAFLRETLTGFGYRVTENAHYIGAEAVRKHGKPAEGIHSVQIEMNRGLYMDEAKRVPNAGFDTVKADMGRLAKALAGFVARG